MYGNDNVIEHLLSDLFENIKCPSCFKSQNGPSRSNLNHEYCRCRSHPQKVKNISFGVLKLIQAWETDNDRKWTPIAETITALSSQDSSASVHQSFRRTNDEKHEDKFDNPKLQVNIRRRSRLVKGRMCEEQLDAKEASFSTITTPIPPPIQASTPAVDLQWKPEWEPEVLSMEEKSIKGADFQLPKNRRRVKKVQGRRSEIIAENGFACNNTDNNSNKTKFNSSDKPGPNDMRISDGQRDGFLLQHVVSSMERKLRNRNSKKTKEHSVALMKSEEKIGKSYIVEEIGAMHDKLSTEEETIQTKRNRKKRKNNDEGKNIVNCEVTETCDTDESTVNCEDYLYTKSVCRVSSSDEGSIPPLHKRLSSGSKWKTPPKPGISPQAMNNQLNTPRTTHALLSPSMNQRSAERIVRKYSNMRYSLLPTFKQDSLVSKRKLFGKSPGWSRQKQMRREMTMSSKIPLSVHRTSIALGQQGNSPAASNYPSSTSKTSYENKRSGRTKEVVKNFLSRLRSRSRSRSRPYKPKIESTNTNPSCTDITFTDIIDLSTLPSDELHDNRLKSAYPPASTLENEIGVSESCNTDLKSSHSHSTGASTDNQITGTMLESAPETVMIPGSQDTNQMKTPSLISKQTQRLSTCSNISISENDDGVGDLVLVPDSEMVYHTKKCSESDSDLPQMANASNYEIHDGKRGSKANQSVTTEGVKIQSNDSNFRMKLSEDGQTLSFIRKGNIVRQVSVADVWNRFEAGDFVQFDRQTSTANDELSHEGQVVVSTQCSTLEPKSTCDEGSSASKLLFGNKELYCTDSDDEPDIQKLGKMENEKTLTPEQDTMSSESSNEIGKVKRRKRRVIGSDDDEEQACFNPRKSGKKETTQNVGRREFDATNSEMLNTTQQANNLHREVVQMEAELNELQNLERLIEAEMDGDGDSAIPDSVALPEDDIVVRLTLGLGKKKINHEKSTSDSKLTKEPLEEKSIDPGDEPHMIPSSQDELHSTLTTGLAELPTSQCTDASGKETLDSDASSKSEEKKTTPMHLVASGLRPEDKNSLKRFCLQFGANFSSTYEVGTTTHVVMREDGSRPRVVQRTLKFFLGILGKSWLVTFQWIKDCLFADTLMDEDDYEVVGDSVCGVSHGGPKRARTIERPLFTDLYLCVVGELVDLSHEEFKLMVELGGGQCVSSPGKFPRVARKRFIIVDRQGQDFSESACKALFKRFRVPIVTRDWLFDSIARYCLYQPSGDYIIEARDVHR